MDPKDDPEARIRELERSLNEQARTSELGGGGSELGGGQADYVEPPPAPPPGAYTAPYTAAPGAYGSNHPPPPGTFGTPYPQSGSFGGTPFGPVVRSSSAGFRVGWLVFALMSVVGLGIAGAIFAVFYTTSRSIPDLPTFGNDGNITVKPPSITVAPPSITVGQVPGPTAGSSVPTVVPGGTVSVSGANNAETVVCDGGGSVSVSGFSNTVTITGHCAELTVSGFQNKVVVDSSDTIGASGFNNNVTYRSGTPQIDKSGDNVVEQG